MHSGASRGEDTVVAISEGNPAYREMRSLYKLIVENGLSEDGMWSQNELRFRQQGLYVYVLHCYGF